MNPTDLIGSIATDVVNLFRARMQPVRLTVRLGDVDAVFADISTVHGKKQRLQALGHYYETITATNQDTATEAYTKCLAYWTAKRNNPADLDADMQAQLRNVVVHNNVLPDIGGEVNVNLPGTHCYTNINQLGGAGAAAGGALPSHRYNAEAAYWAGNPMLGMIPLIALVEVQTSDGSWSPLSNAWVHFQLIPPYHDDAAAELADVNALRNTSEQGTRTASSVVAATGPKTFINAAVTHAYSAADPQGYNAHSDRGGKRGLAVLNNVAKDLPTPGFPNMGALSASAHDHAVKGQSNADGEIGIAFSPSFIGGDRYRWRVFIDPVNARPSDGTEAHAVKFETGRFCVKKHILWSALISKPNPTLAAMDSVLGIQERLWILGYDTGPRDGIIGRRTRKAIGDFQSNHAPLPQSGRDHKSETHGDTQITLDSDYLSYLINCGANTGGLNYAFIRGEFSSMHCNLEIEPAAQLATPMIAAEYQAAVRWARGQVNAAPPAGLSQRYNFIEVFDDYFNTPFLIDVKEPTFYNRSRGRGFPRARRGPRASRYANYWQDMITAIYGTGGMLEKLFLYFSGQGSVASPPNANINCNSSPGLVVVTASRASPMMIAWNAQGTSVKPVRHPTADASGIGGNNRACTVFYGRGLYNNWPYQGDGFSRNTMHEMGHVLYKRHHNTSSNNASGFPADHDTSDRCVMGYRFCEGEFCGKCHLKIRGWDISQMPP